MPLRPVGPLSGFRRRFPLSFTFLAELAARYKDDGMLAYVELVQRKEKEIGCDVLTHQKWSVVYPCLITPRLMTFAAAGVVQIT